MGYFLTNNLAAGLDLALSYSSHHAGETKSSEVNYGIGPFVRFYVNPVKKLIPFLEASGTFLSENHRSYYKVENKSHEGFFNLFGGIGVSCFIKENLAIEALGGYSRYLRTYKTTAQTYYDVNSLALKVGVIFILGNASNN